MGNSVRFLYELNTLLWLDRLSLELGERVTLGTVPADRWDDLAAEGCDALWLMGLWRRSRAGFDIFRKSGEPYELFLKELFSTFPSFRGDDDLAGSPYSIASYEPDPLIAPGGFEEVLRAKEELSRRGIGLIADFVPNHTGPDHPWVREHPEFYIRGSERDYSDNPEAFTVLTGEEGGEVYFARGRDPHFAPWSDTLQLDYGNPALRRAMAGELRRLSAYADGFRCDMAMLVLSDIFKKTWEGISAGSPPADGEEFWEEARGALPSETVLIAEAYGGTEGRLLELGFDYVYDKWVYDIIMEERSPAVRVAEALRTQGGESAGRRLRFLENHDEERAFARLEGDAPRQRALATLLSVLPGVWMTHEGEERGHRRRHPVQLCRDLLKREGAAEAPPEIHEHYVKLREITGKGHFESGSWRLIDVEPAFDETARNLLAILWRDESLGDEGFGLAVVNPSAEWSQGRVLIGRHLNHGGEWVLDDELQGRSYRRSGNSMADGGLHVILESYKAHIFGFTPV